MDMGFPANVAEKAVLNKNSLQQALDCLLAGGGKRNSANYFFVDLMLMVLGCCNAECIAPFLGIN